MMIDSKQSRGTARYIHSAWSKIAREALRQKCNGVDMVHLADLKPLHLDR
jgi:hypothetical protein